MTALDCEILPAQSLSTLVDRAYQAAKDKGFHDDDDSVTSAHRLLLIVGEVIEAFEELRSGHSNTEVYATYDLTHQGVKFKGLTELQVVAITGEFPSELGLIGKPEGVPVEIADVVIRLFDYAGTYGIDLEYEVLRKMSYNGTRPYKHGRNF